MSLETKDRTNLDPQFKICYVAGEVLLTLFEYGIAVDILIENEENWFRIQWLRVKYALEKIVEITKQRLVQ
jgi:hypothetical protein